MRDTPSILPLRLERLGGCFIGRAERRIEARSCPEKGPCGALPAELLLDQGLGAIHLFRRDAAVQRGTIQERWGNSEHAAVEVLLEDRSSELFWLADLDEADERKTV